MIVTVLVSTSISEPDIVTSSGNLEGRREFRLVHDPAIGRVENTMLEIDYLLSSGGLLTLETWDSEHLKDIAICRSHQVLFKGKAILLNDVLETAAHIWISFQIWVLLLLRII